MNVVYANLKIAFFTEERSFAGRIADFLSGHSILYIDPTDPSAADMLIEICPDFLFVDADGDPDRALKLLISASSLNRTRTLFFMEKLNQRLVLAAKVRGADAVLLKKASDDRIRERMEDLLSEPDMDDLFFKEAPIKTDVPGILFTHTPRLTIHLIMDYLLNL